MASTVRVEDKIHAVLVEIASAERRPIGKVIEDAVTRYQKEKFWQGVREDFERLRSDSAAWQGYLDEVRLFEGGSMDGLSNENPYYTPEEEESIRAEYRRSKSR